MQTLANPSVDVSLELLPDPAFLLDAAGVVLAANAPAASLFGTTVDALVGRDCSELTNPPPDCDRERETVRGEIDRAEVPVPVDLVIGAQDDGARRVLVVREINRQLLTREVRSALELAFDCTPIGLALFNTDGQYIRVNDNLCRLLGRVADDLLGRRDQELTHPDDRARDLEAAWRVLRGELDTWQTEKRFVRPDGSIVWAIANMTFLRDDNGHPLCWVGQFQDITTRREAEERLRESKRQLASAQRIARVGSWEWDVAGGTLEWSEELCRVYGLEPDAAPRNYDDYVALIHAEDRELVERTIARAYEELGSYHFEHRVVWPDRSVHVLECHGHVEADAEGTVLRMFGTAQDVSQRKRQTAELERLARQDPLTGLENHRVFHEQLRREVSRARRETRPLALAVLDLDHFKAINDTHGHPQGDAVLREIARRLQAQTRDGECLARIGGEEFGWILPGADATGALSAAERARAAIAEEPFDGVGRLTMSVGVCELTSGISARELHRRADLALLEAKRAGRDCTVRHAPGAQRIASAA